LHPLFFFFSASHFLLLGLMKGSIPSLACRILRITHPSCPIHSDQLCSKGPGQLTHVARSAGRHMFGNHPRPGVKTGGSAP
jgi:hypothetical protein